MPAVDSLADLLLGRRVCVLTGAGISTDSGIPDYRGPTAPKRRRAPMQHREFVGSADLRARYWARSLIGWPRFRSFEPNAAHHALARWDTSGALTGLITQNVDRLHHKAGHTRVIELHGALAEVECLDCHTRLDRDHWQELLVQGNPRLLDWTHALLPDGDAELPDHLVDGFVVPPCPMCGGVPKPDVVFFGGSVPRARVEEAFERVDEAEALLVIGSSLTVFSGYRFATRARDRGMPIAVVNLGPTRADPLATLKLEASASDAIPALVSKLATSPRS
ncbi:MAG: NAD-dependent protein deacetylase [Deltaproteobacteria bacterium]|nr:NAD-dependent protein deacetylase [Deltaproteobacteria bacterium]